MRDDEQALVAAERLWALGRLVSGAAHEMSSPLSAIRGLAALLADITPDPDAAGDLRLMADEAQRASTALRALRSFVAVTEAPQTTTVLADAVQTVVAARGHESRSHGIAVVTDTSADLPPCKAPPAEVLYLVLLLYLRVERALIAAPMAVGASAVGARRLEVSVDAGGDAGTMELSVTGWGGTVTAVGGEPIPAAGSVDDRALLACRVSLAEVGGKLEEQVLPAAYRLVARLPVAD